MTGANYHPTLSTVIHTASFVIPQGHIYIHHTVHATSESSDTVVVFDAKGKFVTSWGKQYKTGAHGLRIQKEGSSEFLYLCDQLHSIVTKRTLKGEEVFTLGYPSESEAYKGKTRPATAGIPGPPTLLWRPTATSTLANGYGSSYINQYNSKAEYIRTFGGLGKEAGQLWTAAWSLGLILAAANRS